MRAWIVLLPSFFHRIHGFILLNGVRTINLNIGYHTRLKSLQASKVALTREAGNNDKLASLLKKQGIDCTEIPCIAFKDGPDTKALPATLRNEAFAYIVITSPEAAKVFIEGWNAAGNPKVTVACVGVATGDILRASGIVPVFTPSKATGETLAAELDLPKPESSGSTARVLYPASARAPGSVEEGLTARGFKVTRLNTYDTCDADWSQAEAASAAEVDIAAFGSPSAAKAWAARRGGGTCVAACIGETSATACRKLGWPDKAIFYPDKPGMDGWAQAVMQAVQSLTVA